MNIRNKTTRSGDELPIGIFTEWESHRIKHDPFSTICTILADRLWNGDLKKVLQPWSININYVVYATNGYWDGESYHFDVSGGNDKEYVITLICESLTGYFIKYFDHMMYIAGKSRQKVQGIHVYGALVFVRAPKMWIEHYEKLGYFLIKATRNGLMIMNQSDFRPKVL